MKHLKNIKKSRIYRSSNESKRIEKKLNNLPETRSDETSDETSDDNNNNNDNDDSEDNQISNFVDRVLKKVTKEIVNDDKNDDIKNNDTKKFLKLSKKNADLKKMKSFKNLSNKQVRDAKKTLELSKKI